MATGTMSILDSLATWQFQNKHIERNLDDSAITAAHPDDTLVLAGPPRKTATDLLPIGMLQQISFQQGKPTQPLMAIGGGRAFFTSGKSQTSWSAARLFVNGRNLLRVLHNNAIAKGVDVTKFDDLAGALKPAKKEGSGATVTDPNAPRATADQTQPKYVINLDSELFYMPFGLACLFRNKQHEICGSFYMEACMINSWATAVSAGSSQIMEQVSGVADRILPFKLSAVSSNYANSGAIKEALQFTT